MGIRLPTYIPKNCITVSGFDADRLHIHSNKHCLLLMYESFCIFNILLTFKKYISTNNFCIGYTFYLRRLILWRLGSYIILYTAHIMYVSLYTDFKTIYNEKKPMTWNTNVLFYSEYIVVSDSIVENYDQYHKCFDKRGSVHLQYSTKSTKTEDDSKTVRWQLYTILNTKTRCN